MNEGGRALAEPAPDSVEWLRDLPARVGEILIERTNDGRISLCHRVDAGRVGLEIFTECQAAIQIARFDNAGLYRPLKTAPNLRHGWRLVLTDLFEARRAVDFFYPGRAAAYAVWRKGTLKTTPFRDTLQRQSGMYRVAAGIGDDQANELIGNFCRSNGGCLRTILWTRNAERIPASTRLPATKFDPGFDQTGRNEPTFPLLCQEACNLLVAAAREVVKATP